MRRAAATLSRCTGDAPAAVPGAGTDGEAAEGNGTEGEGAQKSPVAVPVDSAELTPVFDHECPTTDATVMRCHATADLLRRVVTWLM